MSLPSTTKEAIEAVYRALGLNASIVTAKKMVAYAEELSRWNRRVNLTGAKSATEFISGPLFDALTMMPVLSPLGSLVDIGSGGGLPGVPIALLSPEVAVTLVEPRGKRALFLRHIVHHLGLGARVLECRKEALDETFDAAVAQAVWQPDKWLEQAKSVVVPGGYVYVLSSGELSDAALPEGAMIDARFELRKPDSGNSRFSYRVSI